MTISYLLIKTILKLFYVTFIVSLFCYVALLNFVALSLCHSFVMSLFRYVALLNGSRGQLPMHIGIHLVSGTDI